MNLNQHTLHTYDEQLQQLTKLILSLGGEVSKLVAAAREAFRHPDAARVAEAKAADKHINALDNQIEEEATIVLALQNPMAVDLRFVTGVLKITSMLERAGELAKNTVKRSMKMGASVPTSVLDNLERMTHVIEEMLGEALGAFAEKDTARALAVWRRDDEIDDLYRQVFKAMQQDMAKSPENVASGTHVVFAAKNLERIADYTTNIAKTVYYVTSGKRADKGLLDSRPDA
ncbi:MAG: phosphate transport system regulatory protein PhoU [Proteobacteria bacterium]|nr:phosphate transport system regulatory protein PhoU [Pseudomonadota bacterium]